VKDMNTPISFKPLENDVFKRYNNKDFKASGLSLKDYVKNMFDKFVNDNPTIDVKKDFPIIYKDGKFNSSAFDFEKMATTLEKGKLSLSPEIKRELYHSNIGADAVMKVLSGNLELRKKLDLGFTMDRYLSYKSAMDSKKGVEITANQMKNVAYLLYANKGLPIGIDKPIIIDGIKYDNISNKKSNGNSSFEDADTLINGYLDDIKKQITWITNATSSTINVIGYMNYLGMPINTISAIMNQPILKDVGIHNTGIDQYIGRKKKELKEQLGSSLSEKQDYRNYSFDELANSLERNYNKDIRTVKNKEDLLTQYKVLSLFSDLKNDSYALMKVNDPISTLKDMPSSIFKIMDTRDNIQNFPDDVKGVMSIPHIKRSAETINTLADVLSQCIPSLDKKVLR
jgi:hypothetical protein